MVTRLKDVSMIRTSIRLLLLRIPLRLLLWSLFILPHFAEGRMPIDSLLTGKQVYTSTEPSASHVTAPPLGTRSGGMLRSDFKFCRPNGQGDGVRNRETIDAIKRRAQAMPADTLAVIATRAETASRER